MTKVFVGNQQAPYLLRYRQPEIEAANRNISGGSNPSLKICGPSHFTKSQSTGAILSLRSRGSEHGAAGRVFGVPGLSGSAEHRQRDRMHSSPAPARAARRKGRHSLLVLVGEQEEPGYLASEAAGADRAQSALLCLIRINRPRHSRGSNQLLGSRSRNAQRCS